MFEKVNPSHPDKVADRIAGAIVDLAYTREEAPKIAVEVLIGHGLCVVIIESSVAFTEADIKPIVKRIAPEITYVEVSMQTQDEHLANNQKNTIKCGDNGIFKGTPVTPEQQRLTTDVELMYSFYPYDGKYILTDNRYIACQSHVSNEDIYRMINCTDCNPLGPWTGGTGVDTGATNRKLGSDMGDSVTGGGLHGKDLSKADVSVNIYAWLKAQKTNSEVTLSCAIGDTEIDGKPYSEIVEIAHKYIQSIGGFEKFAEWGLIR